jgi:hypothetical protein
MLAMSDWRNLAPDHTGTATRSRPSPTCCRHMA